MYKLPFQWKLNPKLLFQMEFHGLLPFVHDDIPDPVRGVDRAPLGLHASRRKSGKTSTIYKVLLQGCSLKCTEQYYIMF